jgi:HEAT repeat protein
MSLGDPPDDPGAPMSLQELVNRLRALDGTLPAAVQAQVVAAGSAMVPALIAILEEALTDGEVDHGWTPAHAATLLGLLGSVQAVPLLLRILEHYAVIDAYHTEAADALVRLGKPAIEACLEAYATTHNEDMRAGIASVLSRCATKDERSYQTLLDFLEQSPELGAIYLAEYGDSRAISALSQMFDALPMHDQDASVVSNHVFVELRSAIEELGGQLTAAQRAKADRADAPRRRFAAQIQEAVKRLAAQPQSIVQASSLPLERGGSVISKPRKVGRNEPCWCGSGKKYKLLPSRSRTPLARA